MASSGPLAALRERTKINKTFRALGTSTTKVANGKEQRIPCARNAESKGGHTGKEQRIPCARNVASKGGYTSKEYVFHALGTLRVKVAILAKNTYSMRYERCG